MPGQDFFFASLECVDEFGNVVGVEACVGFDLLDFSLGEIEAAFGVEEYFAFDAESVGGGGGSA